MTDNDDALGAAQDWPERNRLRTTLDFLLFRHLRVVRARSMRLLQSQAGSDRPIRNRYDVSMWPDWSDKTFAYCHYGTYGDYLSDLILSIDRPFCFLDIGANQGLFSLIASRNPHCRTVVALEPVSRTFEKLSANAELNALGDRAELLNVALSDRDGEAEITFQTAHSGVATLGTHLDSSIVAKETESIQTISMRTLDQHLPADLPLFVKIDVEGHEETVIGELLTSSHVDRIMAVFYEMDEKWADATIVSDLLESAGFDQFRKYGLGSHYDMFVSRSGQAGTRADG